MTPKEIRAARKKITKNYREYLLARLRKMSLFYHSSLMDYQIYEDMRDHKFAMIYLHKANWYREKLSKL